jgi:pimeloyl-ACP methyl ester carboxylesterase
VSGYDFQAIAEQEVLAAIVKSFKDGKIKTSVKPEKTVLVGHSFGSFISNSILSVYPDLVDGRRTPHSLPLSYSIARIN